MTVVKSNFERKENDLYETDYWATFALLKHLPLNNVSVVWEPAAGNHKLAVPLMLHGVQVVLSDIVKYEHPQDFLYDFLDGPEYPPQGFDHIITNPPYGPRNTLAVRFIERALEVCGGYIALLLTAKFDSGSTREHLFRTCDRFIGKVVLVDRIQWFEGASLGTEDHAWYIWGPTGTQVEPRLFYEANPDAARFHRKAKAKS